MGPRFFFVPIVVWCVLWTGCNLSFEQLPEENAPSKYRTNATGGLLTGKYPQVMIFFRLLRSLSVPSNALILLRP